MRNILIVQALKLVDDIPNLGSIDTLVAGDLICVGDGKKVLSTDSVAGDFNSIATVNFMTKFSTGDLHSTVSIPRQGIKYNVQLYSAPQNKVITLGGITALLGLDIPTEGEGIIVVKNLSYNHAIATQKVIVSVVKKASQTAEQYVDAVVAKLNASSQLQAVPFFTAAKVVAAGHLGITFTTADENVDLFVGKDGIFLDAAENITQEAKCATGKGSDIVQMEKDMSRNQGFQGYVQNTDLWYKQPIQAQVGTNYDVVTLEWNGIAPSPTVNKVVAVNSLSIAVPTGTIIEDITAFMTLLLGQAYTAAGGVETGNETDVNALDNTQS